MSENAAATSGAERVAIGITLGNSNASIAYTVEDQPQVIANEDGGTLCPRHGPGF
jgi:molecular chaperone DnaK (HSP70)